MMRITAKYLRAVKTMPNINMGGGRPWASGGVHAFEKQVLVFPLLVVLLASGAFSLGGRCAAWQWWAAVATVAALPFCRRGAWREALVGTMMFGLFLTLLKGLLPPVFWDNAVCSDMTVYHLPGIQLLIEGWNPVADPLAENITSELGLDIWGMAPVHVAFLAKPLAVFAAVAYHFIGDPTTLTVPGLAFLWTGVALQAARQFHGMVRWVVLGALVWILPMVDHHMFVDEALAFSSCGLLLAMAEALESKRMDWMRLGVWTTWMVTVKLNGVLATGVFWLAFAWMMLRVPDLDRRPWLAWTCGLAVTVAACATVIAWHPYGTSWKTYGHPLYPFATADSEAYPLRDPTWDMRLHNGDYKCLGRWGLWFYHFVSPDGVTALGRWKTGRSDFQPENDCFAGQYVGGKVRPWLWLLFAVLLAHPRGRPWGVAGIALTALVPWEKIGFLRYQPWLSGMGCLAVALMAEALAQGLPNRVERLMSWFLLCAYGVAAGMWMWEHGRDVDFKATELEVARKYVHSSFWWGVGEVPKNLDVKDFTPCYDFLTCEETQCVLLFHEWSRWRGAQCLPPDGWQPRWDSLWHRPLWSWDQRKWYALEEDRDKRFLEELEPKWYETNVWDGRVEGKEGEPWLFMPWGRYYVPWGEDTEHVVEWYRGPDQPEGVSRWKHAWSRFKRIVHIWTTTYLAEAWKWLSGEKVRL